MNRTERIFELMERLNSSITRLSDSTCCTSQSKPSKPIDPLPDKSEVVLPVDDVQQAATKSDAGIVEMRRKAAKGFRRRLTAGLPLRQGPGTDAGAYLPSPEEIAMKTAEIRAGWSETMRESRCQLPKPELLGIKVIKTRDF